MGLAWGSQKPNFLKYESMKQPKPEIFHGGGMGIF